MLNILIADDENKVCQLIKSLVDWEALDMRVIATAENGIDALENPGAEPGYRHHRHPDARLRRAGAGAPGQGNQPQNGVYHYQRLSPFRVRPVCHPLWGQLLPVKAYQKGRADRHPDQAGGKASGADPAAQLRGEGAAHPQKRRGNAAPDLSVRPGLPQGQNPENSVPGPHQ